MLQATQPEDNIDLIAVSLKFISNLNTPEDVLPKSWRK